MVTQIYDGTVTAARDWDNPAEKKKVVPAMQGSVEEFFHQLKAKTFFFDLHQKEVAKYFHMEQLQRAIDVVYRPETERQSHYFFTKLPYQFDGIIHIDHTNAIEPLDDVETWQETLDYV